MNIKHMTVNYHIDITQDACIEYKCDADEDKMSAVYSDGVVHAELWIKEKDDMWEYDEDFSIDVIDKNGNVFDVNLCHALKKFRNNGLPAVLDGLDNSQDSRWLYYEREFYAVVPVLRYWGHTNLYIKVEGTGSNGVNFDYEYETDKLQSISVEGHGVWGFELAKPGQSMTEWLSSMDDYIVQKVT